MRANGAESHWLAAVIAAVMLLVEIPYLLAYAQEARGIAFGGMLWSPHDFAQYAAAMREGTAGPSWLIQDHLTGEPHRPVLIYPFYVALGKLARLLGCDVQLVYHLAEIVGRAVLLAAGYAFCSAIHPTVPLRRVAFLLTVGSGGLSWLLLLLELTAIPVDPEQRSLLATDLNLPEVNTLLVLFTAPHLMLGLALLLLAARSYLACWRGAGHPALTGALVVGLGLTNPFSLVTLSAVLGAHLGVMAASRRRLPRRALLSAGGACLAAAPFLAYGLLVFGADPFWSTVYGRQNVTLTPPPPFLALGLGPLLALAALALPGFLRGPAPERWLVVSWILVSLALMYAPIGVQRRFGFGVQPMLALIAAGALEPIWRPGAVERGGSAAPGRRVLVFGVLLALFTSSACLYGVILHTVLHPSERAWQGGAFQPPAVREAGRWLAGATDASDVVLAHPLTGNYLAAVIPGRVLVGHWAATLDYADKERAMRRFYRGEHDQEGRRRLLAAHGIRYVVYGPHERAIGAEPPPPGPDLAPVYGDAELSIYRASPALAGGR